MARVAEVCTDVFLSREERYWWYKLTAPGIVGLFLQHSFTILFVWDFYLAQP